MKNKSQVAYTSPNQTCQQSDKFKSKSKWETTQFKQSYQYDKINPIFYDFNADQNSNSKDVL